MRSTLLWPWALVAFGCNSPQGPPMHEIAEEINATLRPTEKLIVPGDTLSIVFANFTEVENQDLSQDALVVPPDGLIRLPGIEGLPATGRTPDEVAAALKELYEPVLGVAPSVGVNFATRAPRTFHVLGAVQAAGEFPILASQRITLIEAFAQAGGITYLESYMGNVLLVRWDAERQQTVSWVVDASPKWWGMEDILLQPHDVVFIPDTTVAKVNTWMERYIIRMIPFPRIFYAEPL